MLELEITAIYIETDSCKTFTFYSLPGVNYKAGQFLTFLFERRGREIRRSYSLSSSPDADNALSITIKLTSNGEISRWWLFEAKVGDKVKALPPSGMFFLEWQQTARDIFLTAAGSGITPLYSIIKSALIREPQSRIILVYSNTSNNTTIFLSVLKKLERDHPGRLLIYWLFGDNKDLLYARLGTYNLQRIIADAMAFAREDAVMYTCGPQDYMQTVQITWMTMGFSRKGFRKELFDINALPPLAKQYYDKEDRTITVIYRGETVALFVPYNRTILDAALKKGIDIPYSCKAGRCSTCKCLVRSGQVWMHYNEVLLDEDLARGLVLTCTGHPASLDVTVEIF